VADLRRRRRRCGAGQRRDRRAADGFITRGSGRLHAAEPYTVLVRTDDTGHAWTLRISHGPIVTTPGETERPEALFSGTAVQLYLSLWNRATRSPATAGPIWSTSGAGRSASAGADPSDPRPPPLEVGGRLGDTYWAWFRQRQRRSTWSTSATGCWWSQRRSEPSRAAGGDRRGRTADHGALGLGSTSTFVPSAGCLQVTDQELQAEAAHNS
jgi:hypothetical protein